MKKILLTLASMLVLATVGLAQTPQNTAKDAPKVTPKAEEKAKPVIIPAVEMQRLFAIRKDVQVAVLTIENAQLKIKELNALIEKAKTEGQKSDALETEFWAKFGVKRSELDILWDGQPGQNGDIILTKKEPEKPKVPKP